MDTWLIAMLVFCLAFGALLYYLFIIKKIPGLFNLGKSGALIFLFMLSPILVMVLWDQSNSKEKLQELGFTPYPGFTSSVGIATGTGTDPIWMYQTDGEESRVLEFYRKVENHSDWVLVSEGQLGLVFEKSGKTMSIYASHGKTTFMLRSN